MSELKALKIITILFVMMTSVWNITAKNQFKTGIQKKINLKKFSFDCAAALAHDTLTINNAKVHLGTGGEIFFNAGVNSGGYEIPKNSEIYSIYAGANWMGAYNEEGNLKIAATTYRKGPMGVSLDDFWPGPLNDDGTTNKDQCATYDQIWSVTEAEITAFKLDMEDGSLDMELTDDFLDWKGPFVDENGDGAYLPSNGDYPNIRGEEAKWYVTNDKGNVHTASQGEALGVEIATMVYAFNTSELNNTTFVDYTITNKSGDNYNDTYFGTWLDTDLGHFLDDYVGCDTLRNLAICYNGDDFDEPGSNPDSPSGYEENPPFLGLQIIDGIQNEKGMKLGMSSFIYYKDGNLDGDIIAQTDPKRASDYYQFLKGQWKDGTPLSFGKEGYNVGNADITKYAYPGEPSDDSGWSECVENNMAGDRQFVVSSGPFEMPAGSVKNLTQAVLWTRAFGAFDDGCPTFDGIQKLSDFVSEFYDINLIEGDGSPVFTIDGPSEITIELGSQAWASNLPNITASDGVDGVLPVTVNSSQVDVNTPGEYVVIYTTFDSDGNTSITTVTVVVDDGVGIDDVASHNISIFPNPAVDYIKFNLEGTQADVLQLFTLNGQLINTYDVNSNQTKQIDLRNLKSGIYLYSLTNKKQLITQGRFVKR